MLELIQENLSTIIIALAVAAVTASIIVRMIRNKKKGRGACSCGGGCGGCSMTGICHHNTK